MKKIISIIIALYTFSLSYGQTATPSEMEKAESYFRNSSVITFNEDYSPKDFIGSLIYYKPNDANNLKVLKITDLNDSLIVRTPIDDILYQKMHTKEEVVSAKFLGIFNTKVTNQHLLEVILLRDYSVEAQTFLTKPALKEKVLQFSKNLINAGYHVEFVWKVNVNKLTSRVFKEGDIQFGFNFKAEGSGKIYNKTEDFTKKILMTLQTIDVSLFINDDTKLADKVFKSENSKVFFEMDIMKSLEPKDYIVADKIVLEDVTK